MNLQALFDDITKTRVAIVGDLMLDTYWWGRVDRISPEAPVPVVALQQKEFRLGGAGNVALNAVALGAGTSVFSVIGDDDDGALLLQLMKEKNIDTRYVFRSRDRITTNKIRIVGRNQQMMRLDAEITSDISAADEERLLGAFTRYLADEAPDVVIFQDYNKGVLKASLIESLIAVCRRHGVTTTVDPKKKNFFAYRQVDIFKPNLKEVKEGLNFYPDEVNESTLQQIHNELKERLDHRISLITLSEKGVFFQEGSDSVLMPSHVRNVADVSGAGDTVIAVASVVYAATGRIKLAADIANLAAGLVCEEVGTVAIDKMRLQNECSSLLPQLAV